MNAQKAHVHKTGAQLEGLHGKVREIKQDYYIPDYTRWHKSNDDLVPMKGRTNAQGVESSNYIEKYDHQGNSTEKICYKPDSSIITKEDFKYDAKGNLTEKDWYNSDGGVEFKEIFKYDEKGNNVEEIYHILDTTHINKNSLDAMRPAEEDYYSAHQAHNNIYEEANYDIYKYDEKGNMIEDDSYNLHDTLTCRKLYKYDEKGNLTDKEDGTLYHDKDLNYKEHFKYDKNGNYVEIDEFNSDGGLYSKEIMNYDKWGNCIEFNSYKPDGSLDITYKWKYEYDKHGNWIKMIHWDEEIPDCIVFRQITYWDENKNKK
jgi:hypothetical protein